MIYKEYSMVILEMSDLLAIGDEYDDLMHQGEVNQGEVNQEATKPEVTEQKPKQESVTVFDKVPPSVGNNINSVTYPPTKQTRFSLATPDLEKQLENRIREIIPCARLEFKPNKAEIADVTIMEGNKEQKNDECDRPTRRIGCMNFIHQDRPKEGSISNKYIEVMFFNFEKTDEYERIKPVVVDFFKQMDRNTNVHNSYRNSIQNDIPVSHVSKSQRLQGGKRRKKTIKKNRSKVKTNRRRKTKRQMRK